MPIPRHRLLETEARARQRRGAAVIGDGARQVAAELVVQRQPAGDLPRPVAKSAFEVLGDGAVQALAASGGDASLQYLLVECVTEGVLRAAAAIGPVRRLDFLQELPGARHGAADEPDGGHTSAG